MDIRKILDDKSLKAKAKVFALSKALLSDELTTAELIKTALKSDDTDKGTCMEALEFVTRTKPGIADKKCFEFAVMGLQETAPRVKWEAAKVTGNLAALYQSELNKAVVHLLANTEHPGTVVRWSAAHALAKILGLKTKHNKELIPAAEAILNRETDNAIRKIYAAALKKAAK